MEAVRETYLEPQMDSTDWNQSSEFCSGQNIFTPFSFLMWTQIEALLQNSTGETQTVWEQKPAYLGPARPIPGPGVSAGLLKDFGPMPEPPNAVSSTQADLDHPKIILDMKIIHSAQLWDAFSVKTFISKKSKKDLRKPSDLGTLGLLNHGTALSPSLWWGSERRGWDVGCYKFQKMVLKTGGLFWCPWPLDASASMKKQPFLQQPSRLQAALQEFVV